MNSNIQKTEMYTIIHTIQIVAPYKEEYKNIIGTDYNRTPTFHRKKIGADRDSYQEMWLIINPNNYPQKRDDGIRDFESFKEALGVILAKYNITEYTLHRVDVAVNMTIDYNECYKINAYLSNLDGARIGTKNHFYSNDFEMNHRNLLVKTTPYCSEFYNKKVESNGSNYANTRLEFRYVGVKGLSLESAVEQTVINLSRMLNSRNIKAVTERLTADLSAQYLKERKARTIKTFTEFICKYSDFIFNKSILYGVYHRCMTGTATSWFAKFKKTHNIELIYKSELVEYTNMLKESLHKYIN